ncbi:hypothetical protein, conserved [Babesia bigemina]|uniref:C3H1-type domain-containing protein n=1 Tax=Babesia bigemina TaxID=5866 RepID=A0A061BJ20_BABBI|nr:hypothetical protein, conserved [Babesia bigemina]CDR71476.1 hypothetical protein, conserved [Babesia bigemina]|eukprot:XP_012770422.1 hypothetical protein, conserved [Babesia bigemina]
MGFLSGVLSNIQSHLGQHKNTLDSAIEALNKNKHLGKKGFNAAIGQVVEGVGGYNDKVKESNKKVRDPITTLKDKMEELKTTVSQINTNNSVQGHDFTTENERVGEQLQKFKKHAEAFCGSMRDAEKNILDLNNDCRTKVNSALKIVTRESAIVHRVSDKASEDYWSMGKEINRILEYLKTVMHEKISTQVNDLVRQLKERVMVIHSKLVNISNTLLKYIKELSNWITTTNTFIDKVWTKSKRIENKVIGEENQEKLRDTAKRLVAWKITLNDYVEGMKRNIREKVMETLNAVKDMDGKLKEDLYKMKQAVEQQVKEIKIKIGDLGNTFNGLRGSSPISIDGIMIRIQKEVESIKKHVGDKKEGRSVSDQTDDSIQQNWDALKIDVRQFVQSLTNAGSSSLKQIEEGVKDYAQKFENGAFVRVLTTWADTIVDEIKGEAQKYIGYYVTTNTQNMRNKFDPQYGNHRGEKAVKEAIKAKLPGVIHGAVVEAANATIRDTTVQNVVANFARFADELYSNLINKALVEAARTYLEGEEALNVNNMRGVGYSDHFLTQALTTVLNSVATCAKHFANELKSFFDASHIKNISGALAEVKDIDEQFDDDPTNASLSTDYGGKIDTTLKDMHTTISMLHHKLTTAIQPNALGVDRPAAAVDTAIDGVTSKLEEQLPKDNEKLTTHVKISTDGDIFVGYKKYVKQDAEALEALKNELKGVEKEGSLPQAIGAIRKTSDEITVIGTLNELSKWSENITTNLNSLLSVFSEEGKKVSGYLRHMKNDKIDDQLKYIITKIEKLQRDTLYDAIQAATEFAQEADNFGEQTTHELHSFVYQQINNVKATLTTAARRNYVSSVKALLTAFADKVSQELRGLPEEIERDLRIGFKGLMRVMGGVSNVTGKPVAAPGTSDTDAKSLLDSIKELAQSRDPDTPMKSTFTKLSEAFNNYFNPIQTYVNAQISAKNPSEPEINKAITDANIEHLTDVNTKFDDLLNHLKNDTKPPRTYIFDHTYSNLHSHLSSSLTALHPSHFANPRHPELLDAVRAGLEGFVTEMERVYVNGYDSETFGELVETKKGDKEEKLTSYGKKVSKVCLNVLSILHTELNILVKYCLSTCKTEQIEHETTLGKFFAGNGYKVSEPERKHWELQDKSTMTGFFICRRLIGTKDKYVFKKNDANQEIGALKTLHQHLQTYYRVGHVATSSSKKTPCSIFEMLCWLCGLPCNTAYEELLVDGVSDLFVDPKKQVSDGELSATVVGEEPVSAYPQDISYESTQLAVRRLCSRSYDVLIKIVGYGNAYTTYAVDYCDNSLQLSYPSDPSQCLELLMDILRRLFPVFRFLHSQCQLETKHHGWANCLYGKDISTGKSHCDKHPDDKQTDCLPRSPLQSYLSDTLPGHLPHNLTAMGCKSVCSNCPKGAPGQPCLTPLGFRGFSGSTKTGRELWKVLGKFFDNSNINTLFGLMPKPPSTLPEHFEFASALVRSWNEKIAPRHLTWLTDAVTKQSVKLHDVPTEFTDALRKAYGSSRNTHDHGTATPPDLSSLSMTKSCLFTPKDNIYCAPYLQSLCRDSYYYLAKKHSAAYLSWAVYLPWVFWNSLNNLYIAFCSIACQDWGCQGCLRGEDCKRGQHGANYNCKCGSIVNCRGVLSTFYAYGFTFGESSILLDTDGIRYCGHFYTQLRNVLNSKYFADLFDKCDEFLFKIRAPFIWLNVALWLLSLLYLLHIMVIRLDLLHIKSHLHSPSSHRIAAQSLLAAARVNKLGRVFYLQP